MKKKKQTRWIFFGIVLAVLIYGLVNAVSIWNYAGVEEICQADVVIVLGAGTQNDEVSPVFRERIRYGIWLYQNGYVEKIIFTGGYGEGNQHSDAYVAKQYAMEQGVPEEDILIEEKSTITQENIENAKSIMEAMLYDTALIVSDPLHMKRSMLMAKDYEIEAYSCPTPTSMYVSMPKKLAFLAREVFFYIGYKVWRIGGRFK